MHMVHTLAQIAAEAKRSGWPLALEQLLK